MKNRVVFIFCLIVLFIGCSNGAETGGKKNNNATQQDEPMGIIKFFNSSSYAVSIHRDAFSGPVIAELAAGEVKSVEVYVDNNYGVGTTFSFGFKTKVFNELETACGDVFAYGIDPNMQKTIIIEPGKEKLVTIEQPSELIFETAFLRIINASDNYFELRQNGITFKQTGNGNVPVDSGKTGVYEIMSNKEGKSFENYKLITVFKSVDFPVFVAKYNHAYTYSFDGEKIIEISQSELSY